MVKVKDELIKDQVCPQRKGATWISVERIQKNIYSSKITVFFSHFVCYNSKLYKKSQLLSKHKASKKLA